MIRWLRHRREPRAANAVPLCSGCHKHALGDVVLERAGERFAYCSAECLVRHLARPEQPDPVRASVGVV
jgi:hypothetical protein